MTGIVVGVFALLTALQHGNRADAVTTSTCIVPPSSTVAQIGVGSGTTTLAVNAAGDLTVNSVACTASSPPGSNSITKITAITMSVIPPVIPADIPTRVVLSETGAGGVIPCAIPITGSLSYTDPTTLAAASTVPFEVDGAAGKNLTAGTKSSANAVDANGCGTPDVTVTGMGGYDLVAASNPTAVTLSAGGGTGFDSPTTTPTTLNGKAQGSTGVPDIFVAGDSSETFLTATPGSTLDFSSAYPTCATSTPNPCSLTANSSSAASVATATGLAQYTASITGSAVPSPSPTYTYGPNGDFTTINGLGSGSTTFYPDVSPAAYQVNGNNVNVVGSTAGGYAVTIAGPGGSGPGSGNQVTAGSTAETFTVTGSGLTVNGSSGATTFTVAPPTGTTGGNVFVPGSGAANFYATGTANTVDFTNVLTSGSNAELTINRSGAPQGVGTGGATILPNGGAAVGSVPTYSFLNSATSSSASHFTVFKGAATGFTQFLAGPTGGLTFLGGGVANSNGASFLGSASGVVVNLSGAPVTTSANIGAGTTLSGFTLPDGQVLVAPPTATSCPAASCDTIADLTNVTGPSFGNSTFYAGNAPGNIYNFSDAGNSNTFYGGASTDVFGSTGNDNDYVAGAGSATFNETSQQSPNNTIDFSQVPVGGACSTLSSPSPVEPCSLTVNVSGQQTVVPNFGAALLDAQNNKIRTYGFATGGPNFTTFIGASLGSTTFQGGLGGYTYTGKGTRNTLDFSDVSSSVATTLSFDAATTPTESATLANVPETFSGITTLVGLATGNTVFTGGSTGGYTFKGNGSGNTATFTCGGAIINLSTTSVTSGTTTVGGGQAYVPGAGASGPCAANSSSFDTLVDISNVNDARTGSGTQTADTFVAGSGSEVFGDVTDSPGDTIDFSNVNTGSGAPLTVNVSGAFALGVANDTATVGGGATYTFISGGADLIGADFTTFVGPTRGFATFLAGDPAGHTFAAKGNSNSIDYSAATKGVTVDLSTSTGTVSEGSLPSDTITGLTTVTGSSAGGNNFTAGSGGPYNFTGNGNGNTFTGGFGLDVFSSNGNNNDFIAGSGSATFNDGGSANKLDFTSVGSSLVVNVSGVQVGTTSADTATSSSGATYTFTTFGNNPTTIVGSMQGTSYFAGTATDTFLGQGLTSDTLSFLHTQSAGPLSINVVGTNCASPTTYGQATVNSIQESFCGIKSFVGLPAGNNTFAADSTGGYTYTGSGGTNTADFTAATSGIIANLATGVVTVNAGPCPGTGCDTVSGVTSIRGASVGGNTFVAGQGSETFSAGGVGNAIDFSNLATGSGTALTVNVSGIAINNVSNDTATFNGAVYNFQSGGSGFTHLTGATNGNTIFEAGSTPGYTLTGNGPSNSVDFSTVTCGGVNVNLAPTPGSVTFLGSCPAGSDTVSGLTAAVGSTSGGNKFEAGAAAATYTFTGNGNGNTFVGDPDPSAGNAIDVFSSNGAQNVFTAGSGAATFNDSTPGNTIDFSAVASRLTVNVSGGQVGGTANDTASGGNPYTFSTFGAAQTTIKGSSGGTTFDAGTSPDTFIGNGPTGSDQLSFAFIPSNGPLSITPVEGCSLPNNLGQAVLGSVTEKFCGIQDFAGLQVGNSTFVGDSTSGYTFTATGSNNTADFSAATSGVTVGDLGSVQLASGQDMITGVTSLLGSEAGGNTFVAGPTSETFGDKGNKGGDTIDFSQVPTGSSTPLKVNVSGTPGTYTATVGGTTYSFAVGGAGFTSFTGSSSGNTVYLAGSTPGYSFTGTQSGNSIDFSAVPAGVYVDLLDAPGTAVGFNHTKCAAPGPTCDSLTGLSTVTGSANGGNTFIAGPSGTYTFTGNGNGNTFIGDADPSSASATDVFSSSGNGNDFVAGAGSATFNDAVAGNTIDFSKVTNPLTVNVSNVQVGGTPSDEATGGGPYVFTSFGSNRTTIIGSAGGTTFDAGGAPDTFIGTGPAASNTLSFAAPNLSGQLAITPVIACPAPGSTPLGKALFNSVNQPFCNIATFAGLPGGNSTFVADSTSGYTFTATGTNNTADFSTAASGITADLSSQAAGNVDLGSGSDTVTGVTSVLGSTAGHNTFVAGTSSETFADTGTSGGDAINFSHVVTSSSTPLFVNASSAPVNNSVNSDTASNGSVTDTFTTGGANFTTFIGASSGFTKFAAPADIGGYTFCAKGTGATCGSGAVAGDTADFSANSSGITANVSPSLEPTTGAGLSTGQVSVGTSTPLDTVSGMTNLIGSASSSASAPNTFYGGLTGTTFSSTGSANVLSYLGLAALAPLPSGSCGGVKVDVTGGHVSLIPPQSVSCSTPPNKADTFAFPSGASLSIQGSPGNDDFLGGTAAVTLSGGGGVDALDLSAVPASPGTTTGVSVNLATGSVTGPAIGGVNFTPGCGASPAATSLCVNSVVGSHFDDTYTVGSSATPLSLTGNGGNDTMDLSALPGSAAVAMPPTPSGQGSVTDAPTGTITFSGVPNVIGTMQGDDTFTAGTGTESFTENSNPGSKAGILDFSKVGSATAGVTVSVGQLAGVSSGNTTSGSAANVNDSFSNITTFIGTSGPDTFKQSGAGNYTFLGGLGSNVLDLSNAPSDETVAINPPAPASGCSTGLNANDGTAAGTGSQDTFTCMVDVIGAGAPMFQVNPNQPQALLNGGGNGHLVLTNSTAGATVNLSTGTVTSPDYNFKFTGMSVIDGTPFNDVFVPGTGNVTINGGGGSDGVTFSGAPAAVAANLSSSSYTIPAGFSGAGTSVPPMTAIGGSGGTITMKGISNLIGTKQFNDVLIGGTAPGSLVSGGSGNDRFVLGGGDTFVSGGTGTGTTLDLSALPGATTLDLGKSYPQNTGAGTVTVAPNSIHTVIASPGGSHLSAGTGNVTLVGGPGNDTLAGGNGTQTLIGGGGADTLIAGVGNQTLQGGSQPVTFVPGGCFPNAPCADTLTSSGTGNTLDYSAAPPTANCTTPGGPPCGVEVNLSSQLFPVPQNEPMGGTVVPALAATGGSGANVNLAQANVTTVKGSPQADIIVTGGSGDTVNGGSGDDLIVANSGNNFLTAGTGTKTTFLFNGAGNNVINGGGKATIDFSQAPTGVTVNLQQGTASGGFAGSFQSLTGVLNAVSTNSNDTLIAGAPGGTITGLGGGSDFLQSGPAGGDTLVSGGSASDTFCAEASCARGGTTAGGGNTMTGGFGNDTFYARNGVVDTINGGGGFNSAQVDTNDIIVNNSIQNFIP